MNEVEILLNDLERFQSSWSVVSKYKSALRDVELYEKTDQKLTQLLFGTVPTILRDLDFLDLSSGFLLQPYLLDIPSVSRVVNVAPSSQDSLVDKVRRKIGRVSNRRESSNNDRNSILNSVFLKPPLTLAKQEINNRVSSKNQKSENSDLYQKRLQSITISEKKLLKKMTDLKKNLDKLKTLKFQNEGVKSSIINIKNQLEDLEERKSELYYKRLTLSQNNWS